MTPKEFKATVTPKALVYRALLTQSSTGAPVATILENNLGGVPVWTRNSAGNYTATLAATFTADKTSVVFGANAAGSSLSATSPTTGTVIVLTQAIDTGAFAAADGLLTKATIEIKVYL